MPRKTEAKSNSKILKCIVASLEKGKFRHVLKWINRAEKKFSILFVHKSYPKWHVSYLDLFKELDRLSEKKWEQYSQKQDYESACKVRCKSNLNKLCTEGVLTNCGKKIENKSKFVICYKINDSSGIQVPLLKEPERQKKTVSRRTVAVQKTIEDHLINEKINTSDCPCLSNQSLMSFQGSDVNCSSYNILKNPKYLDNGRDMTSYDWAEASLGFTDGLVNHKIVKSNFEIKNCVLEEDMPGEKVKAMCDNNTENYESTEYFLSANVPFPINEELPYQKVKAMCDYNTKNYESTERFLNANVSFPINTELPYEKVKTMCDNNTENYGSTEFLLYPNNLLTVEKELPHEKVKAMCDNNTENYGSTEFLFYPSVPDDSFTVNKKHLLNGGGDILMNKSNDNSSESTDMPMYWYLPYVNNVSCMPFDEINSDATAVIADRLGGTENSFDLNNLIMQGDVRMKELQNVMSINSNVENMAINMQNLDILDEASCGYEMNEDPFVCCGSRGSCSCRKDEQIVAACYEF